MAEDKQKDRDELLFAQLLLSFQASAWQQLGKVVSPLTGKIESNLEMAKSSIDILGMLENKTKGNLTEHEAKFLRQVLTELRMNYVEELKKAESEEKDKQTTNKKEAQQKDNQSEDSQKKEEDNKS
jgi:PBP1b-binding outer membrane lipoprotein LpoB